MHMWIVVLGINTSFPFSHFLFLSGQPFCGHLENNSIHKAFSLSHGESDGMKWFTEDHMLRQSVEDSVLTRIPDSHI